MDELIEILKALSEESRLRIFALLMDREMCVCEIETCLKMTQSNVSRHLNELRRCHILESYKKAQWAYYKISDTFKTDKSSLWNYLQSEIKKLPTYEADHEKSIECSKQNICSNTNLTIEKGVMNNE